LRARALAVVAAVVVLAAGAAAAWWYMRAERWYHAPLAELTAPVVVEVVPGEPLATVGARLAAKGLIEHPRLWRIFARLEGKAARVRAGEYAVAPGTSPAGLLDQLVEGRVLLHPITLVEGWTVHEALEAIRASPYVRSLLPRPAEGSLMERLGEPAVAAEGQLFPDTYLVPRGTTDLEVARLAHERMKVELAAAWAARRADLPLTTAYQALILASIVEKESAIGDERPRIAGVFANRLRRGMKLQTDPTVIYGLGEAYDGSLHRRDLLADTPWNTYTRAGLPPTPIALPGRESLRAAVAPLPTGELYFVATGRGDGRHEFSSTLEAHTAAVARYLSRLRAASVTMRVR
jgi:UPF0755 protein